MNEVIRLRKLSRRYGKDSALKGINLSFHHAGLIGILGHSGSGKSTLLNILSGIDAGYEGEAKFFGKEWKKMSANERALTRLSRIGYVFQNFRLLELETVLVNVKAPLDAIYEANEEEKRQKSMDLLRFVGMERKVNQRVNTLSGGEKQRVAIARSLACDPVMLLCDEPTGALDEANAKMIFDLLKGVAKKALVIVVSHDRPLIENYCQEIIHLKDGQIKETTIKEKEPNRCPIPKSIKIGERKRKPRLDWGFMISHAFHIVKAKRFRSLLSQGAIALGLGALGIASYLSISIQDEVNASFASIVPTSSIIMGKNNGQGAILGEVYAASLEDISYFVDAYPDMVEDYGTSLLLDYESWFSDDNYFSYNAGINVTLLPGFSMRQINDFKWYDPGQGEMVYPRHAINMSKDEVILGLPYATMANMCLSLQIARSYQSLGDYISARGLMIVLHASHIDWGFEDEELFSVVGVKESPYPCFFHSDHRWNRSIILETMYFRSSLTESNPSPQYIQEVPYLSLSCPVSEFMKAIRFDEAGNRFVFERASSFYHPSLCEAGYACTLNRLFAYSCDKGGIPFSEIEDIYSSHAEFAGRNIVSAGGYYAEPGSIVSGFSGKFFLSPSLEELIEASDAYSDVPYEMAGALFDIGKQVKDGCFLATGESSLRIGVGEKTISGSLPTGLEECAISSSLAAKWGEVTSLHFSMEVNAEALGNRYVRDFRYGEFKVTGVVNGDYDTIYLVSDWTFDGPIELCGMSPFSLEPSGAIFYAKEGSDTSGLITTLAKAYPEYRFYDPSVEISSSLEETMDYIRVILIAFSSVGIGVSVLLFIIVISITISENGEETSLFYVMGITKNNLADIYFSHALIYSLIGVMSSWLLILLCQIGIKFYLSRLFSSPFSLAFSYWPFLLVLGVSLLFLLVIRIGISMMMFRKSE